MLGAPVVKHRDRFSFLFGSGDVAGLGSHAALWVLLLAPAIGLACSFASGDTGFVTESADGALPIGDAGYALDDANLPSTSYPSGDGAAGSLPVPDGAVASDCPLCGSDDAGAATPPPAPPAPAGPPFDAGEGGVCPAPPGPRDLAIVELMIESTAGTGDHGEWIEVASTLGCALNLNGLSGNCPTGAKVSTFEITTDVWIPALGTFVVADSENPAINHALPGLVVPWSGEPGDVLRNAGATVTLLSNGAIVDSVTSPALKLTPGVSVAFPRDCPAALRPQWTAWQASIVSWFPAFRGTPNAPNDDVQCPAAGDD